MDVSAIAIALIGVIGGAAATGVGAMLRTRTSRRTAARLVFAELESNSAIVAFFRATGVWPSVATSRKAWDANSEVLARTRRTNLFQAVSRGYAALEAVAYIAREEALDEQDAHRLLGVNVRWLDEALRSVGEAAMIPTRQLDAVVDRLTLETAAQAPATPPLQDVPASLLSQIVDMQIGTGQLPARDVRVAEARVETRTSPVSAAIRIYDARGSSKLPPSLSHLVRTEKGPPSPDVTVEETFAAMTQTAHFYREVWQRDLTEDAGGTAEAVVHFGERYNNVFWDGQRLFVGDGDDVAFGRFSAHVEIIAHELSHLLLGRTGLRFEGQAGSLVESCADVIGSLVKQYALAQTADAADWLIGAGLVNPRKSAMPLRSLKAPGTAFDNDLLGRDPQVSRMADYVRTSEDNGGVHINSGIPNHAFYLLSTSLGGAAWEQAGMIWYRALTSGVLPPTCSFATFAGVTVAVAGNDNGAGGRAAESVEQAWTTVGVTPRLTKRAMALTGKNSPREE
ncbi:M4 family metallopeptidase [Actinoplanes sp. TBRC 11911]|uniref:M4 family metallopeptidase n=1 Tax=Actinoplanes sp. TBRC 11911 TaxID=2729386 RepID=UPI00145D9CD6|nr:M4 family metallopeptidase [Actinoplanes sp. TBRC 11911]NMO57720.1 M4 family metallopeptidase [Actinoplanes sp. TBRC 11911]